MKVTVTQEMIDKGIPGDCSDCPVALGFLALGYDGVSIDGDSAAVWKKADRNEQIYYLPDEARRFITSFDATSGKGEPFEFEVELSSY